MALMGGVFAQEVPIGEIEDAQIIIEKDKPLTLPKANRVYQKTEVLPVQTETKALTYSLSQPTYSFEPFRYTLNIKEYQSTGVTTSNQNYMKAGFGNYISPLLQGVYGYVDEDRRAGIYVFHESFAKGPIRGKESASGTTDVILSGDLKGEAFIFSPKVSFSRESFYFYGYNAEALDLADPSESNRYMDDRIGVNHWDVSAKLISQTVEGMSIEVKPSFRYTTMGLAGEDGFNTDLNFSLEGRLMYVITDKLTGNLTSEYDFLRYKSGFIQNRNVFQLSPNVRFKEEYFTFKAGVKLAVNSDSADHSAIFIYPDLSAAYEISDALSVFAEVGGGMNPYSLNDVRLTNRYLEDSLVLVNQNTLVSFSAGVQYNLRTDLVLKPYLGYKLYRNRALMGPSLTDTARFDIVYDRGDFGQVDIGVQVKYLNNRSTLLADMTLSSYQTDKLEEAWYLPSTRVAIAYTQLVGESFALKANMIILDGIKGVRSSSSEVVDMKAIVDLGVGGTYAINTHFSAFLELKNLFGVNYERYLNYPSRGVVGKMGFIYRF